MKISSNLIKPSKEDVFMSNIRKNIPQNLNLTSNNYTKNRAFGGSLYYFGIFYRYNFH